MILIDTSAWIASFKKTGDDELKEFMKQAITSGLAVTTPIVILELLQGCRSVGERDALKIRLESLDILSITPSVWEQAYELCVFTQEERTDDPHSGFDHRRPCHREQYPVAPSR